jgi:flavodoxin
MKAIILYASITGNAKGMARIEQQFIMVGMSRLAK